MKNDPVILRAEFNPSVRTYWALSSSIGIFFTIIGIPFLLIWIPVAALIGGRYLRSLECVLTEKTLQVKKGILIRVEKTVPLDKITDLGLVQGPLMRAMGIEALSVETAGSTSAGALVNLPGVIGARDFRDAVLSQKERLQASKQQQGGGADTKTPADGSVSSAESLELLREIRDVLGRIETRLDDQ